jgi:hypothetical protein
VANGVNKNWLSAVGHPDGGQHEPRTSPRRLVSQASEGPLCAHNGRRLLFK